MSEQDDTIDVLGIIKKYLEDNGFEGLAGDGCGCAWMIFGCARKQTTPVSPPTKRTAKAAALIFIAVLKAPRFSIVPAVDLFANMTKTERR